MTYSLVLHPKWKEAVSKQDLDLFEKLVTNQNSMEENKISFISAKAARNYRGDLLATVLIVNGTTNIFSVKELELEFLEASRPVAENIFTISSLIVEPKSVTPWTFIFPSNTVECDPQFTDWEIKIKK